MCIVFCTENIIEQPRFLAAANRADRRRLRELICHRNRLLSGRPSSSAVRWGDHGTGSGMLAATAARPTCCGRRRDGRLASGRKRRPPRQNTICHRPTSWCHAISASVAVAVALTARKHWSGREEGLPRYCRRGQDVMSTRLRRLLLADWLDSIVRRAPATVAHHECTINQLLATVASRRRRRRGISALTIYRSPPSGARRAI